MSEFRILLHHLALLLAWLWCPCGCAPHRVNIKKEMEYGFLSRTSFLFHSNNLSARLLKLLVIFTRLRRAVNTPSEIYGYHMISWYIHSTSTWGLTKLWSQSPPAQQKLAGNGPQQWFEGHECTLGMPGEMRGTLKIQTSFEIPFRYTSNYQHNMSSSNILLKSW